MVVETNILKRKTYYVVDDAQYKPAVQENGAFWYEVIKANYKPSKLKRVKFTSPAFLSKRILFKNNLSRSLFRELIYYFSCITDIMPPE